MDTVPPSPFRFAKPTTEDLPRLARLGYDAAMVHCGACRNYHLTTPYFRAIGIGGIGPEFAWESQLDTLLRATAGRETVRWLLAGSADAGLPGLLGGLAAARPGTEHTITVVDRCQTPLILCRAHAAAEGAAIETVLGDLRDFRSDGAFDAVLMHFTTIFFADDELVDFLRHTGSWLAPGGVLVAGFLHDRPSADPPHGNNARVTSWREAVIRAEIEAGRLDLPEDIDTFIGRMEQRGPRRTRRFTASDVTDVVRAAQLRPREVALLPFADEEAELWGHDCRQRCFIVADRA
ncbi:MAG: class I SAM-dependent methyltransferase [Bauldia sp.]|nr:class I SAM-dependent methyltransferase [Bauldia sp.]